MKMKLTTLSLLLAAAGGLFASPMAATPGRMHRVDYVQVPGRSEGITETSSLNFVRAGIGSAHEQLTPNLWVYHNFRAARGAGGDDCCELVVHFVNERVASIYLANPKSVAVMARRINKGKPESFALASVPENLEKTEIASVN